MVDASRLGGDSWQPGQWWLHSSYNLCEGNGAYQCAKTNVGFAPDVTDTREAWGFWPESAALARPGTWGQAVLAR